jgi:hypothetical protein
MGASGSGLRHADSTRLPREWNPERSRGFRGRSPPETRWSTASDSHGVLQAAPDREPAGASELPERCLRFPPFENELDWMQRWGYYNAVH